MHLHRIFDFIRRLLGRERALARCPVAPRRRIQAVLLLASLSAARLASASVLVTGDVTPADDPFTLLVNEGLPGSGNSVNPFEAPDHQTFYEGRHIDAGTGIPADDTNVNIPEIIVGQSAFGTLLIDGESALRDEDLIIGDMGMRGGVMRTGTGVVRITGFGSLYNNDPNIIPPGLPANFSSQTPRPPDVGYDLYVGRAGNGTLEISAGARAEIQDAVVVANDTSSTGSILVDGFDSFLGSGGFDTGTINTDPHLMLIGRLGVGYMTITNGGTVQNDVLGSLAGNFTVAASIGADPFQLAEIPEGGGVGTVTVNGAASKWIVGGTLQIGGFHLNSGPLGIDLTGATADYNSEAGHGTLYVQDGALVNVHSALGTADPTQDDLYLAIGRFGRVILSNNGTINVGGGTATDARGDTTIVLNDGVIQGSGRILTGTFRNRYLGEVRVGPNEHLIIDSSSQVVDASSDITALANYGVMQVFGTEDAKAELEFERAPADPQNPIQPFLNLRIARPVGAPIGDFYGGLISAQHSILRFRSGLLNSGMMAFTAGNNYVTGNVVNLAGPVVMPADGGIITVSGPGTKVTFENDLINAGVINISGGAIIEVLARHSFVTAGDLKLTLTPDNANQIFSAGDGGIAGKLSLTLSGFSPGTLHVGDSFQIISVTGNLGGVDLSDPNYPKVDLSTMPDFSLVSFPNLATFGLPATTALVPIYTSNSVLVSVVSHPAAIGPDFNGDGVVNGLDLNIWLANVGITSGASVVQGDADGDGDVDGDDFLFWQRNAGHPMPWTGAGSGSESSLAASVPEPTALALLLVGSVASLSFRPRRRAR